MLIAVTMKLSILCFVFFIAVCKGQQRIAGGESRPVSSFPYAVALLSNSGTGLAFTQACGGSILTSNAILSAASCFYTGTTPHPESSWRARAGSSFSNAEGTIYLISRITAHPAFQPASLDNNIAVLRTRYDMTLLPGVAERAFLPGAAYSLGANQRVQAIGWGADEDGNWSDQLQEVEVFTIDQAVCANRYSTVNGAITSNMLCAGWLDVGIRGQCEGDVGSPLIDNGTVVGVFSHTYACADFFIPAVNTRVQPYTRWIISTATA